MTKSELMQALQERYFHLPPHHVEAAVKSIIEHLAETLSSGRRIEIRGFGSFSLRCYEPRLGRNPKTGEKVAVPARHLAHFKPGKELRERVKASVQDTGPG